MEHNNLTRDLLTRGEKRKALILYYNEYQKAKKLLLSEFFNIHYIISDLYQHKRFKKYKTLRKEVYSLLSKKLSLTGTRSESITKFLNMIYKLPIHSKNIILAQKLYSKINTDEKLKKFNYDMADVISVRGLDDTDIKEDENDLFDIIDNNYIPQIIITYYNLIICSNYPHEIVPNFTNNDNLLLNKQYYEIVRNLHNNMDNSVVKKLINVFNEILEVLYYCFSPHSSREYECADEIYQNMVDNANEVNNSSEGEVIYHVHWLTYPQQDEFIDELTNTKPCKSVHDKSYHNKLNDYLITKFIKRNPHLYIINHINEPATKETLDFINDIISPEVIRVKSIINIPEENETEETYVDESNPYYYKNLVWVEDLNKLLLDKFNNILNNKEFEYNMSIEDYNKPFFNQY